MSQSVQGGTGAVAQQLAAAPRSKETKAKTEQVLSDAIPFEIVTFRVPKSSQDFVNEKTGEKSRRVAQAVLQIKGSGICFTAWVMQMKDANDNHLGFKANLPHIGFNPVFEGKDSANSAALEAYRDTILDTYGEWATKAQAQGQDLSPATVSRKSYRQLDVKL